MAYSVEAGSGALPFCPLPPSIFFACYSAQAVLVSPSISRWHLLAELWPALAQTWRQLDLEMEVAFASFRW